jgi:hypothetical protein
MEEQVTVNRSMKGRSMKRSDTGIAALAQSVTAASCTRGLIATER